MPEIKTPKRPASHRWAIGIFAFITLEFIVFLLDIVRGRPGADLSKYWIPVACLAAGALALFALVFGGRQRWAYYLTAGTFALWLVRAIYILSLYVADFISGRTGITAPYFHLEERDQPFVVQQTVPLTKQVMMAVMLGLLVWLFYRFTFGRASRSYYGFCEKKENAG
ncbi:MAG: hypothetical protein P4N60_24800 [Verrucomicrobiae bacterium]|nr:hypothetical protein [Verrucomicrobiae bacterium]